MKLTILKLSLPNLITFCFFLIFCIPFSSAQVQKSQQNLNSFSEGLQLQAAVFQLPERIDNFRIDSLMDAALIELRGVKGRKKKPLQMGKMFFFDLKNNEVRWTKKIDYELDHFIYFPKTIIKEAHGHIRKAYLLDYNTGSATKQLVQKIFHVVDHVGLGYAINPENNSNQLYAVDILENKKLWSREINRKYGVSELKTFNDSTLLISASGIHFLNLKNGSGYSHDEIVGTEREIKDHPNYLYLGIPFGAVGVVVGIALGDGEVVNTQVVMNGIESNLLVQDSFTYLAVSNAIFKVDHTGDKVWSTPLPPEFTSNSTLFLRKNKVYCLNNGYGYLNGRVIKYGRPYFKAFDTETGEEVFSGGIIEDFDGSYVKDFNINDTTITIVMDDLIGVYSIQTGEFIKGYNLAMFQKKKVVSLLDRDVYLQSPDSTFYSPYQKYPSLVYAKVKGGTFYKLNEDLSINSSGSMEDSWRLVATYNNYKFIFRNDRVYLIDKNGMKISEFISSDNVKVVDEYLYYSFENKFHVVSLSTL